MSSDVLGGEDCLCYLTVLVVTLDHMVYLYAFFFI